MVKKFNQYFIEESGNRFSKEELEDQFLRLKEIYNCYCMYYFVGDSPTNEREKNPFSLYFFGGLYDVYASNSSKYIIRILSDEKDKSNLIEAEIDQMSRRIEGIYKMKCLSGKSSVIRSRCIEGSRKNMPMKNDTYDELSKNFPYNTLNMYTSYVLGADYIDVNFTGEEEDERKFLLDYSLFIY
jgi:hypothetical protein